jgi:hypothetical protein
MDRQPAASGPDARPRSARHVRQTVRLSIHSLVVTSAALTLLASCGPPAAVQPTLDALESLGYTCGGGTADNVPSGLKQWRCLGSDNGSEGGISVEGNDGGVAAITLAVVWPVSPDPNAAREAYRRLVTTVPPFETAPALADALANWTGEQMASTIGGAQVIAECRQDQCIIIVNSAQSPIEPLRLP